MSIPVDGQQQGDQIYRISPNGRLFTLGSFFENYRCSPSCWAYIFHGCGVQQKMGLATIWSIFSKSQLVTLVSSNGSQAGIVNLNEKKKLVRKKTEPRLRMRATSACVCTGKRSVNNNFLPENFCAKL
jgi:hypothetical protein